MDTETIDAVIRWKGRINTVLIEYLTFSALANKETYGGEIVDYSKKYLDEVKIPTVYSIIRRSIELGLIEKVPEEESQEKADVTRGTARQYYRLTKQGLLYQQEIHEYLQRVTSESVMNKLEEGI